MKKIILSLAIAAFIGAGSFAYANTTCNSETMEIVQDGKKKTTATKKDECKGEKSKSSKSECQGDKTISKKSCCSDGKTAKKKTTSPEKK